MRRKNERERERESKERETSIRTIYDTLTAIEMFSQFDSISVEKKVSFAERERKRERKRERRGRVDSFCAESSFLNRK